MALRIARIPYLNAEPFYSIWDQADFEILSMPPRKLGEMAAAGTIDGGLLPVVDFFRLEKCLIPIANLGIAVRGAVKSVVLFSRKPIDQLQNETIGVTVETSTSFHLLNLILEQKYRVKPRVYQRTDSPILLNDFQSSALSAMLWIGNEVLRRNHGTNPEFPYQYDLGREWWEWKKLPFVFALWVMSQEVPVVERNRFVVFLEKSFETGWLKMHSIAQRHAGELGSVSVLYEYLSNFVYRIGAFETAGMLEFRRLLDEYHTERVGANPIP